MQDIKLLDPNIELNYSLMESIKNRRTIRKICRKELSLQEISNILWVACGETKKATKTYKNRRTIPSACNSQKVSIMICLQTGVYRYIEDKHILVMINDLDIRNDLVKQTMLKNAPLGIIYIGKKELKSGIIKHNELKLRLLLGTEVGAMSQNIYLYCTGARLSTVIVGLFDKKEISNAVELSDDEDILFTQIVG